ncbi:MAG: helix-turn-helix transcriptional regulator [Ruminococcus sp.]|nr:helix-turn-helix transcriptional regulator [Ruminococcus sp.]
MTLQGNNFGERLLEARKSKDFTRDALAKKANVSSKTIANYESGDRYPTVDIASRLAEALDVSVAALLGEEGDIIEKARAEHGSKGVRDLRELIDDVSGLFAGGELPEEDKDALMRAFSEAYFIAKEKNRRFTPKKYRKD